MKQKRKHKIRKDHKGKYILRKYFVSGKMKLEKIYIIDGIPADEYYQINADPITLLQNGDYEMLNEKEY